MQGVYLSLGRCPLIWPVTGQSLRTLPYCIPHRGLETGHQRLKEEEEEYRKKRGGRASRGEGGGRKRKEAEQMRWRKKRKKDGKRREGGRGERGSKVTWLKWQLSILSRVQLQQGVWAMHAAQAKITHKGPIPHAHAAFGVHVWRVGCWFLSPPSTHFTPRYMTTSLLLIAIVSVYTPCLTQ